MKRVLCIVMLIGFLYACKKQSGDSGNDSNNRVNNSNNIDCSGPAKSFATDISPIIQSSCSRSGCHNNGSFNGPGSLVSYSQIFNARAEIRVAVASGQMPLNGSLTAVQKNAILCWIDSGAPNN